MTTETEVKISLIDSLNPSIGYQMRINHGERTLLFTSRHPVTGADLLTLRDCLEVAAMYAPAT